MEDYRSFLSSHPLRPRDPRRDSAVSVRDAVDLHLSPRQGLSSAPDALSNSDDGDSSPPRSHKLFILSAKDEKAVQRMKENLKDYLRKNKTVENEAAFLDNLAYTLGNRRSRFSWTATLSGDSISSLARDIASGKAKYEKAKAAPRLGFVFTGQGAQWWAMGKELIDVYPAFKATLVDCNVELAQLGTTWCLIGMF